MERKSYNTAVAFHASHYDRTFQEGDRRVDPWLRDVLVSLQVTLQALGDQIDRLEARIEVLERR